MTRSCAVGRKIRLRNCYRYVIGVAITGICLLAIDSDVSRAQTVKRFDGDVVEIDNAFHDAADSESASRKTREAKRPVSSRVARLAGASMINEVYPDGHVPPNGRVAGDDGILIYQNTLGTLLLRPNAGFRVADDLSTLLGGPCGVSKLRVRVSGGVEGGGGIFRAQVRLLDGCPIPGGGALIPDTIVLFTDLADNAAITHELVVDFSDRGVCDDGYCPNATSCQVSLQNCIAGSCRNGSACEPGGQACADTSQCRLHAAGSCEDGSSCDPDMQPCPDGTPCTNGFCVDGTPCPPICQDGSPCVKSECVSFDPCSVSEQNCSGGICEDGSPCDPATQDCADESACVGSVCVQDPLEIPPTVWMQIRFDTDDAGIVYGMPAQVGFSADAYDQPLERCTSNFGGWPEFPHASFWVEMFTIPGCLCSSDSDCDDDVFCNGLETCGEDGICDVGDPQCGNGELCNEATNACDCANDEYCDDGEFCNGAEACGPDGTCQSGPPSCAPGEVCDEVGKKCLCDSDDDCDDEAFCNGIEFCREGGICVPVFGSDCNGNDMEDECDLEVGTSDDCDGNLVPDECQADCNGNGIADACESNADCNFNGVQDLCDLAVGTSGDCNNNGVPDECELHGNDCNANDIPDPCESNADCNDNGVQDICDLAAGKSTDCNANGVLDDCDFDSGTSVDCNGNALPDECDLLNNDCNGNGFPDDCDFGELNLSGRTDYDVGRAPQAITSGDFDLDGDIDLAIARGFFHDRGYVHVLLNDGSGSFSTAEEVEVGQLPRSIASGDFNGDGLIDVVTANHDTGDVSILLNRGGEWLGFASPEFVDVGGPAQAVAVGDVDLDGDSDIVVVLGGCCRGHRGALVLLNSGDADFTLTSEFGAGNTPRSVALFDANNDGLPDVAVASQFSDAVRVSINRGFDSNGAWQGYFPPLRTGGVEMPFFLGTADFDRDGYVDVVVTRRGDGTVESAAILLNKGNDELGNWLGLLPPRSLRVGDIATLAISAADFNKDGWTDLAFVGQVIGPGNTGTLVTLMNRGVDEADSWLEFGTARSYTVGQYPFAVASIDINGNNAKDLVVANRAMTFGGHQAGPPSVTTFFHGPTTLDCNASGVPDECELAENDCDSNGVPDGCDADCQPNGIPDACDFFNGLSADCNDNTVPDECETDCNGNGVPDDCEADLDFDADGFLDECDACLDSDLAKLIAVEECPTGVPNTLLDDGCTMNDMLNECSLGAHSHGELTACVARHANEWRRQGLLSGKDVGRITHCAGLLNQNRPVKRAGSGSAHGER